MYAQGQPIIVLKEGTQRETGPSAQAKNIAAARAIANVVKSTLGPRGMDKMLVDSTGDVVVTNDGATILKEIDVSHPAAKMLVEVAKAQDDECGDGTSCATVMAGELLGKAQQLLEQNVHATIIAEGYRLASRKTKEILQELAMPVASGDRGPLLDVARTALGSKTAASALDMLANVALEACLAVSEEDQDRTRCDIENIQVQKVAGGALADTRLVKGIVLDQERADDRMPARVPSAKIALVDVALEVRKPKTDTKIEIKSPEQLEMFVQTEQDFLGGLVEKVAASGANVLLCQKGIDDLAKHQLSKANVYAVARVNDSDMQKLAKATGATIVSTLDDLNEDTLGVAGEVCEEKVGEDTLTMVTECHNPKAVSLLLRGGSESVVDEYERGIHDALSVVAATLEDGKLLPGGGAWQIEAALALRDFAPHVGGREQLAIEAFADALEIVPRVLAANAGLDEIDMLVELRRSHKKGETSAGVNVSEGRIQDMVMLHVLEPLRVGTQQVASASEAATMILRIDDVISSKAPASSEGLAPVRAPEPRGPAAF